MYHLILSFLTHLPNTQIRTCTQHTHTTCTQHTLAYSTTHMHMHTHTHTHTERERERESKPEINNAVV